MKILSIRKGFQADHSSTSYEFFAIDKPLNPGERKDVSRLSSRARPTRRRVSFIYHGDFSDLPGGWRPLVKRYYDVMYSESYGWWVLVLAFKTDQRTIREIKKYEFSGSEDMGVNVDSDSDRVIVSISCRLCPELAFNDDSSYYDYDDEEEYEDIDEAGTIESNNELLDLLAQNREYLKNGDFRLLYGVWKEYGFGSEEYEDGDEAFEAEAPPEPPGMDKLPKPVKRLLSLLEQI